MKPPPGKKKYIPPLPSASPLWWSAKATKTWHRARMSQTHGSTSRCGGSGGGYMDDSGGLCQAASAKECSATNVSCEGGAGRGAYVGVGGCSLGNYPQGTGMGEQTMQGGERGGLRGRRQSQVPHSTAIVIQCPPPLLWPSHQSLTMDCSLGLRHSTGQKEPAVQFSV